VRAFAHRVFLSPRDVPLLGRLRDDWRAHVRSADAAGIHRFDFLVEASIAPAPAT